MMRQIRTALLATIAFVSALVGGASAQENIPFGPENYEQDFQIFAPYSLDLDNMADKQISSYFFHYDKLLQNYTGERTTIGSGHVSETIQWFNGQTTSTITATDGEFAEIIYRVNPAAAGIGDIATNPVPPPNVIHNSLTNVAPRANFALGNRYELGYHDQGHGWMVGVLDGPDNNQSQIFGAPAVAPPVDPAYNGPPAGGGDFALGFGSVPVLFETPPGFLLGFRDYMNNFSDAAVGTQRGILAYVGNYGANAETNTLPFLFLHLADDINGNGIDGAFPVIVIGPGGLATVAFIHDFDDLHKFDIYFNTVAVHSRTNTNGVELMWSHDLTQQHYMAKNQNNQLTVSWGARFLRLYDEFDVNTTGSILGPSFWDTSFTNNIVGPQVGFQWVNERQRWRIQTDARFMAGYNIANWNQIGLVGSELVPGALNRLLYARPTAFDHGLRDQEFAPVGELRVAASYHITNAFALNIGYTGTAIGGIRRAAPSVHYSLPDMGYLDAGNQTMLVNGVDFGVEFVH